MKAETKTATEPKSLPFDNPIIAIIKAKIRQRNIATLVELTVPFEDKSSFKKLFIKYLSIVVDCLTCI